MSKNQSVAQLSKTHYLSYAGDRREMLGQITPHAIHAWAQERARLKEHARSLGFNINDENVTAMLPDLGLAAERHMTAISADYDPVTDKTRVGWVYGRRHVSGI